MIHAPYRWSARPLVNIKSILEDLFIVFPRNVWRYRAWLARDADFDWEYLAEVMERKLRFMSEYFAKSQTVERWGEMVAETREAADIIARMRDTRGERADKHGYAHYAEMTPDEQSAMWQHVHDDEEADRKRFGELMAKIEWWWD